MNRLPINFLLIAAMMSAGAAHAATITKSATGIDLTAGASWGGAAPVGADVATWSSTSLGTGLTAATNVTWGSVNITGAAGNIGITGAGTITTGNITLAGNRTLSIGNAITLSGNSIYTIADTTASTATDATLSGLISGGFGITKEGAGTLVLSGLTNSFSGNVVINAGELQANVASAVAGTYSILGTGTVTANAGTTLRFRSNGSTNIYTYTNAIALNNATLAYEDGNHVLTGAVTLTGANTVTGVWSGKNLTITGAIGGTGSLTKSGVSGQGTTLVLAGANTYTGGTTVADGTLSLDFSNAAAPVFNILAAGSALTLSGGTTLSVTGKTLTANNQTLLGTTLSGATGGITVAANAGASGTLTLDLGVLTRTASATLNITGNATVMTSTGTALSVLTDATTGAAYATVGGTDWAAKNATNTTIVGLSTLVGGYTVFNDASAPVTLSGNAHLTQALAGTYTLAANSTPTTIRNITTAGNTVALAGNNLSTSGILSSVNLTISGNGTISAATAGGELVLNQTGGTTTISSQIVNNSTASSLTKNGGGTVILTNTTNGFTGNVVINGGELQTNIAQATPSGIVTTLGTGSITANSATLRLKVAGDSSNNITYANAIALNGSTLIFQDGNHILTGGVTLTGSNSIGGEWAGKNLTINSAISGTGSLTKSNTNQATTLILAGNATYTGSTSITGGSINVASGGIINGTSSISLSNGNSTQLINNGSITTTGGVTVNGGSTTSTTTNLITNAGTFGATGLYLGIANLTAAGTARGGSFTNNAGGSLTLTGDIYIDGQGSNTPGSFSSAAGSTFTMNGGTVSAGFLTLVSSSTANTAVNKGGTYTQSGGTTTLSRGLYLASTSLAAIGAAGNDAALNLSGGTLNTTVASLNGTTTITGGILNVSGFFYVGDVANGRNGIINQSGGTVNLTSSIANDIRFGHWVSGTMLNAYNLSGGTLNALSSAFNAGYDGNGSMTVSATGVANLNTLAVSSRGTISNPTPNFTFFLGSAAAGRNGGRLNVGSGGITLATGGTVSSSIRLGDGTVGSFANWSSSANMTLTDAATGTTFNTLDSVDGTTARTVSLSGILSGAGRFVKTGAGTITLSGANTHSGGVSVNGGTLASATSGSALGTGAVTIGGGALQIGAAGISGIASLTVNTGALNTASGTVTTTGAFALIGGTWTVGAAADTLTAGSFNLTGGTIDLSNILDVNKTTSGYSLITGTGISSLTSANFSGGTAGYLYGLDTNGNLVVTPVPEPSTYGLIGAGALAAALARRRKRA